MTFYDLHNNCKINSIEKPVTVALGCFDGLHKGHREVIRRALSYKEPCCVFTFSSNLFDAPRISSLEAKLKILSGLGVAYACIFDFSQICDMSWEEFASDILIEKLGAVRVVCGFNYTFGKGAEGDPALLCDFMKKHGFECIVVDEVKLSGETVSSSAVRSALAAGDCEKANELLGRVYSIKYKVIHGNGLGSDFDFPTINHLLSPGDAGLARGVYICSCEGHPAVTNVGIRPTIVDGSGEVYETFIIDYKKDLYGKEINVNFHKKIRDEHKFPSVEELKKQIQRDVEVCLEYFKTHEI